MPRNTSGTYSLPPGVLVSLGDTITPSQHNPALNDIAIDLNAARPIATGGTGASSATDARENLKVLGTAGGTITGDLSVDGDATFKTVQVSTNTFTVDDDVKLGGNSVVATDKSLNFTFNRSDDGSSVDFRDKKRDDAEGTQGSTLVARIEPVGVSLPSPESVVTRARGDARYVQVSGAGAVEKISFTNTEGEQLTDQGQIGWDNSEGILARHIGGTYKVWDGANVVAGTGMKITNAGAGATGNAVIEHDKSYLPNDLGRSNTATVNSRLNVFGDGGNVIFRLYDGSGNTRASFLADSGRFYNTGDIDAGRDSTASRNLIAGSNVNAGQDMTASRDMTAGRNMDASGFARAQQLRVNVNTFDITDDLKLSGNSVIATDNSLNFTFSKANDSSDSINFRNKNDSTEGTQNSTLIAQISAGGPGVANNETVITAQKGDARYARQGTNKIGNLVFARTNSTRSYGDTISGSNLTPGAVDSDSDHSLGSLPGTWQCLGETSSDAPFTLWGRIA